MALRNWLLLSQIAGYLVGLILSFCIVVPMSMHHNEFEGKCLLFSIPGNWDQRTQQLNVEWGSRAYCNYVLVVGIFMTIACCTQIYRLCMFLCKNTESSFLSAFLETVGCTVMCALGAAAAIIVTIGFRTWCQKLTDSFPSCEDAAGEIGKKDEINSEGFYTEIGTVQFSIWAAFATWVGLAVFATLKVVHFHQLENIQMSMYRERQRLITDNGVPRRIPGRHTSSSHILDGH